MCVSAGVATLIGSALSTAGSLYNADRQRKAANQAADAARDAQSKAETSAAQSSNARLAMRRRAIASSSLVTDQTGMASSGRPTLGG